MEIIRDGWGLREKDIVRASGLPQRMVMDHIREMQAKNRIRVDGGVYLVAR